MTAADILSVPVATVHRQTRKRFDVIRQAHLDTVGCVRDGRLMWLVRWLDGEYSLVDVDFVAVR